ALLLLLIAGISMLIFFVMNGLLLFKLEAYNQIFSAQVKGVWLKRFFYFFIPALLIMYFVTPTKKNWWLFLFCGLTLGILSYLLVGGTRANIALVIALFVFVGIAQGYISIPTLLGVGVAGILAMFVLAMKRYNLDLADSNVIYYFLQLTRDTFSPWENLSQLLAYEDLEFQGMMPIIRDFYVYIPRALWENRPDLVVNTANYFTWDILNYYAGLAISPTLIGSYYIMGGIPFIVLGAIITGLIIKGFDALYFYAVKLPYISRSAVWKVYCFANIFTITVLIREGIDAFISRFVLFNLVFFTCYIGARLIVAGLRKAGFVSITVKNVE
ncbi:MAG TPA: O-antigen assembly polymerase, partial [Pasteurellaceae bacterium]|nr:O-antigen assembly polymerase [Pasteurellaceae bacterium]